MLSTTKSIQWNSNFLIIKEIKIITLTTISILNSLQFSYIKYRH